MLIDEIGIAFKDFSYEFISVGNHDAVGVQAVLFQFLIYFSQQSQVPQAVVHTVEERHRVVKVDCFFDKFLEPPKLSITQVLFVASVQNSF